MFTNAKVKNQESKRQINKRGQKSNFLINSDWSYILPWAEIPQLAVINATAFIEYVDICDWSQKLRRIQK